MKRNKLKMSGIKQSNASAIFTGVILATLLSLLLTALMANFVLNGHLSEKHISAISFVIRTISVFAGSLAGASLLKQKFLRSVAIIVAGYLVVLIGIGIVLYDGSFKNFIQGIVSVLSGGGIALLILLRPKGNKHKRVKISL